MIVRTLYEDSFVVQVGGRGAEVDLRVVNGSTARFSCDTADLAQALEGVPIHLSAPGESILLFLHGDTVRLVLSIVGHDRDSCCFSASDLRDALREIQEFV